MKMVFNYDILDDFLETIKGGYYLRVIMDIGYGNRAEMAGRVEYTQTLEDRRINLDLGGLRTFKLAHKNGRGWWSIVPSGEVLSMEKFESPQQPEVMSRYPCPTTTPPAEKLYRVTVFGRKDTSQVIEVTAKGPNEAEAKAKQDFLTSHHVDSVWTDKAMEIRN